MKRQRRLKDSKSGGKRIKISTENPIVLNPSKSAPSSNADVVLPTELLQKICFLLIEEQKRSSDQKEKIERDRKRFIDRVHIAATNSTLRQCVLKHNQRKPNRRLRINLERKISAVYINDNMECVGETVEQVTAALNFFQPNELLLSFKEPRMEQVKYLFDALSAIDLSSVNARMMKVKSTASVTQQVLSCLPAFVQQLTHIRLTVKDDWGHCDDIIGIFQTMRRCCSLQMLEFDCAEDFDADVFDCASRSMVHLAQLPELKAIRLFGIWTNDWGDRLATLCNQLPTAISSLCIHFDDLFPNYLLLLSDAVKANLECVCCLMGIEEFKRLRCLVKGIIQGAPNCQKIVFELDSYFNDNVTRKRVDQMCNKLLKWLEETGDQRTKIELVAQKLLKEIDAKEDLKYTLGERSIVVNREPKDGIQCVFICLERYRQELF